MPVTLMMLLLGCGGEPTALPGNARAREAMALQSADRLREEFNRGACESIFDEADLVFRIRQSKQGWMDKCAELRRKLGTWRSFNRHVDESGGFPLSIVVEGDAEFVNGGATVPGKVRTVWHFEPGRAVLFLLYVNGEVIPPYSWPRKPPKRYSDPPQRASEAA